MKTNNNKNPEGLENLPLKNPGTGSNRSVEINAKVTQTDSKAVTVSIHDISKTGFSFKSYTEFNIEKKMMLKIPGFEALHATFVWKDDDQYGCRFNRPLHSAIFEHIALKKQAE
ncbi:PilZ domain-containing protein [Parasphingorhabdus sp.]|uniref:PilZ domain-containing protein n=1 Tax=Parasphingorhabdus sp. TaxID=2709688 RepID=UPI003BAFF9CD